MNLVESNFGPSFFCFQYKQKSKMDSTKFKNALTDPGLRPRAQQFHLPIQTSDEKAPNVVSSTSHVPKLWRSDSGLLFDATEPRGMGIFSPESLRKTGGRLENNWRKIAPFGDTEPKRHQKTVRYGFLNMQSQFVSHAHPSSSLAYKQASKMDTLTGPVLEHEPSNWNGMIFPNRLSSHVQSVFLRAILRRRYYRATSMRRGKPLYFEAMLLDPDVGRREHI